MYRANGGREDGGLPLYCGLRRQAGRSVPVSGRTDRAGLWRVHMHPERLATSGSVKTWFHRLCCTSSCPFWAPIFRPVICESWANRFGYHPTREVSEARRHVDVLSHGRDK